MLFDSCVYFYTIAVVLELIYLDPGRRILIVP
jgi:hypothetical protein